MPGQRKAPTRTRYLLAHVRWHGRLCLGALYRLSSQLLLWGRGTPRVALAILHALFVIVMDAWLWPPCKKIGSMPLGCRHSLSLIFWLQSQVTLVLSTFNMSSCLQKLQPACMAGCASCLLVRSDVMTLICRAPGGSDPTPAAASLLPISYSSCGCPSDCTGYCLAMGYMWLLYQNIFSSALGGCRNRGCLIS